MTQFKPNDAVIVDAVRTPMGKSKQGVFRHVRAENLAAELIKALVKRNPKWDFNTTDDCILGCVKQTKEQGLNIARYSLLLAGLPNHIPAQTVNRLCGSSMQAIHNAFMSIRSNIGHNFIVGGVEHMGHVPMDYEVDLNPASSFYSAKASNLMGLTAEMLARFNVVARDTQDQFALRSHKKASEARTKGYWAKEIISIEAHNSDGFKRLIEDDEVIRHNASLEEMQTLKPVFDPKHGTITAGNSSALSDGASAMLVMSYEAAQKADLTPRARIKAIGVAGCDPALMGRGPVPASQNALKMANLQLKDIDTIEVNEAFAAQTLSVIKEFGIEDKIEEKTSLQGGSIALGHPLGCSGARIVGTLLNIMERKDTHLGLATMCIGMGQGIATIIERV